MLTCIGVWHVARGLTDVSIFLCQVERLGIRHVKGVLLFGPPGTGKTLIARQIGKMLNGKEPKIVNGPEVLNKFVGASCWSQCPVCNRGWLVATRPP